MLHSNVNDVNVSRLFFLSIKRPLFTLNLLIGTICGQNDAMVGCMWELCVDCLNIITSTFNEFLGVSKASIMEEIKSVNDEERVSRFDQSGSEQCCVDSQYAGN